MRFHSTFAIAWLLLPSIPAGAARAQDTASAVRDSFSITTLQAEALRRDPRNRQLELQSRAAALRLLNIAAESRPALSLDAQGQYQSAVTRIGASLPGVTFPTPPHDTYDAHLLARQSLFDPSLSPRRAIERAQLEESQAEVRATLYALRVEINEAFFGAASLQERASLLESAILELTGRLREARERLAAGVALPGDTAALAATILQREQDLLRLGGDRSAALARLSALVGRELGPNDPLIVPDLATRVASARAALDGSRDRPEYARFDAARRRLAAQQGSVDAQRRPRIAAYGRGGYGRPGLNMLSSDFQTYWLGGVQLHWAPWTWGAASRDRELIAIQGEIVGTSEAAFGEALRRNAHQSLTIIEALERTAALDDRVVQLREVVEREAAAKLREGVITAADYTSRGTELLTARVARVQHRVELAQARATFLTIVGVELP